MSLFAIYLENLILATDMITIIGHRKEFPKRTFRAPALRLGESFAHQQVQRHTFFKTESPYSSDVSLCNSSKNFR